MVARSAEASLDLFLDRCCLEIERRAELARDLPIVSEGARAFRSAVDAATALDAPRLTVPLEDQFLGLSTDSPLVTSVHDASNDISWISSPRTDDGGTRVAIAPLNERRDLGDLICGLMLVASGAAYPEHCHPLHEVYLPLAGAASWRYGGANTYRPLANDALVYNPPNVTHGARAGNQPLLALYVLWQ